MNSPKISIVIPSFNKVHYVAKTLDSIIKQKYSNLEVIIQDGGSTDGTLEILRKYTNKYPKIFFLQSTKDGGQLDAINIGMRKSTGEIVTYINADDIFSRGAFENVSKAFKNHPEALWFSGRGEVIDINGKVVAKPFTLYKNFLLLLNSRFTLLVTNYLMQPSVFITRNAFLKYGPFTGTNDFVTEYDLWLKLSKYQMPIVINKYISQFRIEPSSKTKTLTHNLLSRDEKIVFKYSKNPIILIIHKLHNIGRILIGKFI